MQRSSLGTTYNTSFCLVEYLFTYIMYSFYIYASDLDSYEAYQWPRYKIPLHVPRGTVPENLCFWLPQPWQGNYLDLTCAQHTGRSILELVFLEGINRSTYHVHSCSFRYWDIWKALWASFLIEMICNFFWSGFLSVCGSNTWSRSTTNFQLPWSDQIYVASSSLSHSWRLCTGKRYLF